MVDRVDVLFDDSVGVVVVTELHLGLVVLVSTMMILSLDFLGNTGRNSSYIEEKNDGALYT